MGSFSSGEYAIYPTRGLVKISSIETRTVAGQFGRYYVMQIIADNGVLMIPVDKAEHVGLRPIADERTVVDALGVLSKHGCSVSSSWNQRYRGYMDKLRAGGLLEIAEVYRDLRAHSLSKSLSFTERRVFDSAKALLVAEIAASRGSDVTRVEREIAVASAS